MGVKREIKVRTSTSLISSLMRDTHQRLVVQGTNGVIQRALGILSQLCYGTKENQPVLFEVISSLTVLPCSPPRVAERSNDNMYVKNSACLKR